MKKYKIRKFKKHFKKRGPKRTKFFKKFKANKISLKSFNIPATAHVRGSMNVVYNFPMGITAIKSTSRTIYCNTINEIVGGKTTY